MLKLHLPLALYDLFVYDFHTGFFQASYVATLQAGYSVCVFILRPSCAFSTGSVLKHRDRLEIVQKSCGHCSVSAAPHRNRMNMMNIVLHPCGFRTEAAQRSYRGYAADAIIV